MSIRQRWENSTAFECTICRWKFDSEEAVQRHLGAHHQLVRQVRPLHEGVPPWWKSPQMLAGGTAAIVAGVVLVAILAGDRGDAPEAEWTDGQVIEAAGLELDPDFAGGGYRTPGDCSVGGEPDIFTSREDVAQNVSDLTTGAIDPADEEAIRVEAEEDNVATNPDLTAGVQVNGVTFAAPGEPTTESDPAEDCIPQMEEGLAALRADGE